MPEVQPPVALQNPTEPDGIDAETTRHALFSSLFSASGVIGDTYQVVPDSPESMNVVVQIPAAGRAIVVPGTRTGAHAATQGPYLCFAAGNKTLTVTAANPSEERWDLVVARVKDSFQDAGLDDTWELEVVTGTADPSPSDPPVPEDSETLARIRVGAGATEITAGDIDDLRTEVKIREELLPDLIASNIAYDDDYNTWVLGATVQAALDATENALTQIGDSVAEVPLSSTLLDSDAASIDVTDISQDYKHLRVVVVGRSDRASNTLDTLLVRVNNDSTGNYDQQRLSGSASTTAANESFVDSSLFGASAMLPAADAVANQASPTDFIIYDYAATTWDKAAHGMSLRKTGTSTGNLVLRQISGWWRSTAAVNRITVSAANGDLVAGTRLDIYGIRGAA